MILHELAEICIFKTRGIPINKNTFIKYPNIAYEIHLKAMEIELDYASSRNNKNWIKKRLIDIESYLNDPNMPRELIKNCIKILKKFRGAK